MPNAEAPSKTAPRSNVSVTLSIEELHAIDEAAREKRISRAQFIREAAVAHAQQQGHAA